MPTEDILPMWVAEQEGLFTEAGVDAEVVVFDSAQNLSAAITAGEVDLAMTDPMRALKLAESGVDLSMQWITLGTEADQGRFGILAGPDSEFDSLEDIVEYYAKEKPGENWGVGVAANTVPEYVLDKLAEAEGLKSADIPTVEVPSLPDRFSLVASGDLPAAALPGSMLALGEATGMKVLADDASGDNLSQSVMVVRSEFAADTGGAAAVHNVSVAWDEAVEKINASPEDYRSLLAEKANLNERVVDTYPISTYPLAHGDDGSMLYPPARHIDPQVEWMKGKGYLDAGSVFYDEADGMFYANADHEPLS